MHASSEQLFAGRVGTVWAVEWPALYALGRRSEEAALILRNSPEVVREHYIKFEKEGKKVEAMELLAQAYDDCAMPVQ